MKVKLYIRSYGDREWVYEGEVELADIWPNDQKSWEIAEAQLRAQGSFIFEGGGPLHKLGNPLFKLVLPNVN